jgi:SAM-dependent methyltransferase
MRVEELETLRCPTCKAPVKLDGRAVGGFVASGWLLCDACLERWPIRNGLPDFIDHRAFDGTERLMKGIYDLFAPLHDPLCKYVVPAIQGTGEAATRKGYLEELGLAAIARAKHERPVRILEVGIGTGVNYELIRKRLPGVPLEYWGIDTSTGMIRVCRRRHGPEVRLAFADAHELPFADGSFDRAFHVGAIGSFRSPGKALAELARVAVAGTPIVVVDEQLAPGSNAYQRAAFRALTFYEANPASPRPYVPARATAVAEKQISPFFYCLRFATPS